MAWVAREGGGALKIPLVPRGMIEGVRGGVDRETVTLKTTESKRKSSDSQF